MYTILSENILLVIWSLIFSLFTSCRASWCFIVIHHYVLFALRWRLKLFFTLGIPLRVNLKIKIILKWWDYISFGRPTRRPIRPWIRIVFLVLLFARERFMSSSKKVGLNLIIAIKNIFFWLLNLINYIMDIFLALDIFFSCISGGDKRMIFALDLQIHIIYVYIY